MCEARGPVRKGKDTNKHGAWRNFRCPTLDVQQKNDSCPQLAVILGWQVSFCEFCRSGGFQCLFLNTFSQLVKSDQE